MAKAVLTEELIKEDLRCLSLQLEDIRPRFDYAQLMKPMLDKLGYDYDFNEKSGEFTMYIADGIRVLGKYNYGYRISASISLKGIKCEETMFEINFCGHEQYEQRCVKLISALLTLKEKYIQILKEDISTELLGKAYVEPYLEKIKLSKAVVRSVRNNSSEMEIEVHAFGNVMLKTQVNLSNYEERCDELANALSIIPKELKGAKAKDIMYHTVCKVTYPFGGWREPTLTTHGMKEFGCGRGFNPKDDIRISYNDKTTSMTWPNTPEDKDNAALYEVLSQMGYVYYVDGNNLIIVLNEAHFLSRDITSHKVKCLPFEKTFLDYAGIVLHDQELIYALKMYAKAASVSLFSGYGTQDFFNYILKNILSSDTMCGINKHLINPLIFQSILVGSNTVVKLYGYGIKYVRNLWCVFSNWDFIAHWPEHVTHYPHIKVEYILSPNFTYPIC